MTRGPRVGLCETCRHSRQVESARSSVFWLCERSKSDARFTKYPPLPVLACMGYEKTEGDGERER